MLTLFSPLHLLPPPPSISNSSSNSIHITSSFNTHLLLPNSYPSFSTCGLISSQPVANSAILLRGAGVCRRSSRRRRKLVVIKAYIEQPNSINGVFRKVVGALPIVGLVARILSDEGGLGDDLIDFAEFRRRVGNRCGPNDSQAFYDFRDRRRGKAGEPFLVLLCCWLAAVGAGLLKSEDILSGVARLRVSNDLEFEEETFFAMMNEAKQKRSKLKLANPDVPMDVRAEKALEAIYVCCFGKDPIEEEDERLLSIMLRAVFPSVNDSQLAGMIKLKVSEISEVGRLSTGDSQDPQNSGKEARKLQLKEFELLKDSNQVQL